MLEPAALISAPRTSQGPRRPALGCSGERVQAWIARSGVLSFWPEIWAKTGPIATNANAMTRKFLRNMRIFYFPKCWIDRVADSGISLPGSMFGADCYRKPRPSLRSYHLGHLCPRGPQITGRSQLQALKTTVFAGWKPEMGVDGAGRCRTMWQWSVRATGHKNGPVERRNESRMAATGTACGVLASSRFSYFSFFVGKKP